MPQKPSIPRVCRTCGDTFLAKASAVKRGGGLYCKACHGPPPPRPLSLTIEERLAKWSAYSAEGHRLWHGWHNQAGYGMIRIGGRSGYNDSAHRVAWELVNGPIPEGLHCLHHCDIPACIEVTHLHIGTDADNAEDRMAHGIVLRGAANPQAKLTDAEVIAIRAPHATVSNTDLGLRFGVSSKAIRLIMNGTNWKHLGEDER